MTDPQSSRAVADGGPLDGQVLGSAQADSFEVRMDDNSLHLYLPSDRNVEQGRLFTYAGRR